MGVKKAKPAERSFVLRLPEEYAAALEGLVEGGLAKSTNDLIVRIIASFIKDMKREADDVKR